MKFIMTNQTHPRYPQLKRIMRVSDGTMGGYIQYEHNLCQDDNSWVDDWACVFGNARIYDNATVAGYTIVSGNTHIFGANTLVLDECVISNSSVSGVVLNGGCNITNSEIVSDKKERPIFTDLKLASGSVLKMSDKIINNASSWEYGLLGQSEKYVQKANLDDVQISIEAGKMIVIRVNE